MHLTPEDAQRLAEVLFDADLGEDAADEPSARLPIGPFSHYRITRLIGVGGMGEVYEAQQDSPARRVAIKVIRPDLVSPELLHRFEHETRALARLQHPGIAPIYEAGQAQTVGGPVPFFAMEFVDGSPLTSFAIEARLKLRARLELFLRVCDAVEHAHRKGVIHRDLKPANILVDLGGQPRILDFGIARLTDSDLRTTTLHTEVGKLLGTLPYMSPEQAGGDPDALDTRADVYSLGVIVYELLAGRSPFELRPRMPVPLALRTILDSDPAQLSSIDRVFRGDLDTIVGKALTKDKERRYQSVGELSADLRHYLADEAIVARRPSGWYHFGKFARRNRGLVTASAVALAAVLAGSSISVWLAISEASARHNADALAIKEAAARRTAEVRQAEATHQAALASATTDFLADLFAAASPQIRKGKQVTPDEMVDLAAAQAAGRTHDDPELGAAIQFAIGKTYLRLGRPADARSHLETALEARRRLSGDDDAATLNVMGDLAVAHFDQGETEAGIQIAREVCERRRRLFGDADASTRRSLSTLSSFLLSLKRVEEATPLLESAVAGLDLTTGLGDREVLDALHNLAGLRLEQGRFAEAEELVQKAIQGQRAALGDSDPKTLESLSLLAGVYRAQDRMDRAEAVCRELITSKQRVFGEHHPATVQEMSNLSGYLIDQGKLEEAESLARRVFELRRQASGDLDPGTIASHVIVARVLQAGKRFAEADDMLSEILAGVPDTTRDFHRLRMSIGRILGECMIGEGKFEEAERLLIESLAYFRKEAGPKNLRTVQCLRALVDLYTAWDKPEEVAKIRTRIPPE